MLEIAPVPELRWHGDHSAFRQHCTNMLREWGPRPPRCSDDVPVFGPELELCAMAVDVALPARMVSGPAKLLVPWINQHGLLIVSELRRIDLGRSELQSTEGRRLYSCFLDFGLQPAMLATALGGPPRQRLFQKLSIWNLPSHPRLQQALKPMPQRQPRALEKTPARPPTSPARRVIDTKVSAYTPAPTPSRQPIVKVPQAAWTLPPELAAPPASPVAPQLNSSSSSSIAATTSPLPQASTANGAASESPGGPAARTRARISPGKSPTPSAISP